MRELRPLPASIPARDVQHRILSKVVQSWRGAILGKGAVALGSKRLTSESRGWPQPQLHSGVGKCQPLWNEKNFLGVGIFDFSSGGKATNVHVALIGSVGTGNKTRFARDRNAVRNIPFGWLDWGGSRFRWRRRLLLPRNIWRRRRIVRIERLLPRWIFSARRRGISCYAIPLAHRRLIIVSARGKEQGREQSERQREFHRMVPTSEHPF